MEAVVGDEAEALAFKRSRIIPMDLSDVGNVMRYDHVGGLAGGQC